MSGKHEYAPPTGAPPNWSSGNQGGAGYTAQSQPEYSQQEERGWGAPPQQSYGGYNQGYNPGYNQGHNQGYGAGYPPQGGYNQYPGYGQPGYQQQPTYVQQQRSSGSESCLMGCLGALCICCTLDMLF